MFAHAYVSACMHVHTYAFMQKRMRMHMHMHMHNVHMHTYTCMCMCMCMYMYMYMYTDTGLSCHKWSRFVYVCMPTRILVILEKISQNFKYDDSSRIGLARWHIFLWSHLFPGPPPPFWLFWTKVDIWDVRFEIGHEYQVKSILKKYARKRLFWEWGPQGQCDTYMARGGVVAKGKKIPSAAAGCIICVSHSHIYVHIYRLSIAVCCLFTDRHNQLHMCLLWMYELHETLYIYRPSLSSTHKFTIALSRSFSLTNKPYICTRLIGSIRRGTTIRLQCLLLSLAALTAHHCDNLLCKGW